FLGHSWVAPGPVLGSLPGPLLGRSLHERGALPCPASLDALLPQWQELSRNFECHLRWRDGGRTGPERKCQTRVLRALPQPPDLPRPDRDPAGDPARQARKQLAPAAPPTHP